jgi:hypothetical protein
MALRKILGHVLLISGVELAIIPKLVFAGARHIYFIKAAGQQNVAECLDTGGRNVKPLDAGRERWRGRRWSAWSGWNRRGSANGLGRQLASHSQGT